MSKAPHTEKPWRAVIRSNQHGVKSVAVDMCRRTWTIHGARGNLDQTDVADAHLIAAAPKMLEALTECLPLFDMVTALDDHGSNALGQAENLIRSAIAMARGAE